MTDEHELLKNAPLRIGISTRALFNLEEEHAVFVEHGARKAEADLARRRAWHNAIKRAQARLAELRKDPDFGIFMSAAIKAGWARRRAALASTQASGDD